MGTDNGSHDGRVEHMGATVRDTESKPFELPKQVIIQTMKGSDVDISPRVGALGSAGAGYSSRI